MRTNELVILEMIMIDYRYSDLKELIKDDDKRCVIVNDIVESVLNFAELKQDYQTFVNIELDNVLTNIRYNL